MLKKKERKFLFISDLLLFFLIDGRSILPGFSYWVFLFVFFLLCKSKLSPFRTDDFLFAERREEEEGGGAWGRREEKRKNQKKKKMMMMKKKKKKKKEAL